MAMNTGTTTDTDSDLVMNTEAHIDTDTDIDMVQCMDTATEKTKPYNKWPRVRTISHIESTSDTIQIYPVRTQTRSRT